MPLSTRELLYLEDTAKLMESINKNCTKGQQSTTDPQVKEVLTTLVQDHTQWMSALSNLVTSNGTLH